ncbi:MAG: DMT family transporter [Gammaproteobacteria bacterium]|nr:DMT family transporter [Gammaproteobacteria bacterium]
MKTQTQSYIYAIGAVFLWSTVASVFKLSLNYIDIWQLLLVSSLTATLCLLSILVYQNKLILLRQLKPKDCFRLLVLGILNPFLYYVILFKAYDLLPAQIAQSLNYTWAITLMFLSIPILKHKVTSYDIAATLVCYAGIVVICMGGDSFPTGQLSMLGISLAIGSTIIWALYWLYKAKDKVDPMLGLFLSFLFSLPFIMLSCYLFSDIPNWNNNGILGGVYVGLFEMGITYVLWLSALQLTSSVAKISTLIYCSPFLSLFFIHFFVGEAIAATTVVGLSMIVGGLLLQRKNEVKNC